MFLYHKWILYSVKSKIQFTDKFKYIFLVVDQLSEWAVDPWEHRQETIHHQGGVTRHEEAEGLMRGGQEHPRLPTTDNSSLTVCTRLNVC